MESRSKTHIEGKESRGGTLLYDYRVKGRRLTRGQAIITKCHECCGGYPDGRNDCEIPSCPLYRWMPYRDKKKTIKSEDHYDERMMARVKNGAGATGQRGLKKYLEGKTLGRGQAIKALCYDCIAASGRKTDCEIPECPLYPSYAYHKGAEKGQDPETTSFPYPLISALIEAGVPGGR